MDEVGQDLMNVLVSLHKGYGLGDAVAMSAVLRHVVKHRKGWCVDYQAEEGKHQVGRGIVDTAFAYGDRFEHGLSYPRGHYDAHVEITLYDRWYGWHDRPNTQVAACLHEHFGLGWDAACSRYSVAVGADAVIAASTAVHGFSTKLDGRPRRKGRMVAVHYQGRTARQHKDLTHYQAQEICAEIDRLGCKALLLDWDNQSPGHYTYTRMTTPSLWGRDAEMVTAVIAQCSAFVGIDSGPAKCASATDTPSLVVWRGHHPVRFHDPAPNTTHLVPDNVHSLHPVCGNPGVTQFFEDNYGWLRYGSDPVPVVKGWLREVLEK